MLEYTYKEIERAVRGRLLVPTRRAHFKGGISIDTRTLAPGDMFVALRGRNFDGHAFIDEAFERGARLCLAEESSQRRIRRKDPDIIYVDDAVQALGRLGAFHRRNKKIPVIAVTGSCGKTTTKELIAHLLSDRLRVLKSEGSENNQIGVPKTLLKIDDHDVVVLELGTNQLGEIRYLTRLADPTHAVVTMIGNSHLMGFRSIQGVKREKMSMIDGLSDGACVIYNADDRNIQHPRLKKLKSVRVGFSKRYDVYAERIHLMQDGSVFLLNGKHKVVSPILGRHNILNTLLAAGCAKVFKIPSKRVSELVTGFSPTPGRVRYREVRGIHWIDDSYNANPSSLKAAIELFKSYPPKGRKILALGDMLELGPRATAFHRDAGKSIAGYSFDLVCLIGKLSKRFADEARASGFDPKKIREFPSSFEAGNFIKSKLKPGDTVLLKGSRGMHMERIMEACGIPTA
ncbi:MAG: UDP-N-acetylmuramoyl-tripeptide--D-alanyl-D-alanine ligase [Candidatus Omnitrophica bacterium]|nr:UDP-N-acetylmuramoyl-tripeptide--D-alanyl-D-alanine ligase [Candidatus Omnitrophota bacterium]